MPQIPSIKREDVQRTEESGYINEQSTTSAIICITSPKAINLDFFGIKRNKLNVIAKEECSG